MGQNEVCIHEKTTFQASFLTSTQHWDGDQTPGCLKRGNECNAACHLMVQSFMNGVTCLGNDDSGAGGDRTGQA